MKIIYINLITGEEVITDDFTDGGIISTLVNIGFSLKD